MTRERHAPLVSQTFALGYEPEVRVWVRTRPSAPEVKRSSADERSRSSSRTDERAEREYVQIPELGAKNRTLRVRGGSIGRKREERRPITANNRTLSVNDLTAQRVG